MKYNKKQIITMNKIADLNISVKKSFWNNYSNMRSTEFLLKLLVGLYENLGNNN